MKEVDLGGAMSRVFVRNQWYLKPELVEKIIQGEKSPAVEIRWGQYDEQGIFKLGNARSPNKWTHTLLELQDESVSSLLRILGVRDELVADAVKRLSIANLRVYEESSEMQQMAASSVFPSQQVR